MEKQPSLFTRNDTFFGVCEAIGEDLGFNPLFLRLFFAGLLFWNPLVTMGAYLALGVAVAAARYFYPNPQARSASADAAPDEARAMDDAGEEERDPLPIAA